MALDGRIEFSDFAVPEIQNIQHRPLRQKFEARDQLALIGIEFEFTQRLLGFNRDPATVQQSQLLFENRLFFLLQIFFDALDAACDLIEIGEHEFEVEHLGIPQRIDRPRRVGYRRIVKDAQHVGQRIHFAQWRQHGGIFRAVLDHAADVDVFDRGIGDLFRIVQLGELFEPRLRHSRDSDVRGRTRRLLVQLCARQNFEERGLADLRKPDDPRLHRLQIVAYQCAGRLTAR